MRRSAHLALATLPLLAVAMGPRTADPDPVTALRADLAAGRRPLAWEPGRGYLRALLRELNIAESSQTLVFSKTSLQTDFISRKTPRAIYFGESAYVAWIPGAPLIEIMSVHPTEGVQFWAIPNVKGGAKVRPESDDCTRCHGRRSSALMVQSVFAAPSGYSRPFARSFDVTPRTPLRQRWGGWYVTGTHNGQRHMGNVVSGGTDEKPTLDPEKGANVTDLRPFLDTKRYLSPHSDLVALMVLESQMEVQNVLTTTAYLARTADTPEELADATEPLVEALLGVGEARLTSPVRGTSRFAEEYAARGPLYKLDLKTRLYRHGCSPLIASPSFRALPDAARALVWTRIKEILSAETPEPRFAHLSKEDRAALAEVLARTEPEFAKL